MDTVPKMVVRAALVTTYGKEIQLDFSDVKSGKLLHYFNWDCLDRLSYESPLEETISEGLGLVGTVKRSGNSFSVVISNRKKSKEANKCLSHFTKGFDEELIEHHSWLKGSFNNDPHAVLKTLRFDLIRSFNSNHSTLLLLENMQSSKFFQQAIVHLEKRKKAWSIVHVTRNVPHYLHWHYCFSQSRLLLFPRKWCGINPIVISVKGDKALSHKKTAAKMGEVISTVWHETKGNNRFIRVTDNLHYNSPDVFEKVPVDICGQGENYKRTTFFLSRALKRPGRLHYVTVTLPKDGLCAKVEVAEDTFWHTVKVKDSFVKTMRVKNSNKKERSIYVELRGHKGVQKSRISFDTLKKWGDRTFDLPNKEKYVLDYARHKDGIAQIRLKKTKADIRGYLIREPGRTLVGYRYSPYEKKHIALYDGGMSGGQRIDFSKLPFFGNIRPCKIEIQGKPLADLKVKSGYVTYCSGRFEITGWYKCNPGSSGHFDLICIDHKKKTYSFMGSSTYGSQPKILLCGRHLITNVYSAVLMQYLAKIYELTSDGPKEIKPKKKPTQELLTAIEKEHRERQKNTTKLTKKALSTNSSKQTTLKNV